MKIANYLNRKKIKNEFLLTEKKPLIYQIVPFESKGFWGKILFEVQWFPHLDKLTPVIGALMLAGLAQLQIPLPGTPVPLTGQTFGILVIALILGRNRGALSTSIYLLAGALGMPVFTQGKSGLFWGPTFGYLFGMLAATVVMGHLYEKLGFSENNLSENKQIKNNLFFKFLGITILGELIIFGFGLVVLSFFVPQQLLLSSGLWPFLPGEILKMMLVSALVTVLQVKAWK